MANEYPVHVRREARRMWLTGRFSDAEIAAQMNLPRADTIRDWRATEGWESLSEDVARVIKDEVKRETTRKTDAVRSKYDQLSQVIESRAVRALSDPRTPPRDLKAIAATLVLALKIREKVGGLPPIDADNAFATNIADLVLRESRPEKNREQDEALGRCRGSADSTCAETTIRGQFP